MTKKKGLGRGLGALIQDSGSESPPAGGALELSVELIVPNPYQPRSEIKSKDIKALAESIKDRGVLEPLMVHRIGPEKYELIAGERRWRAAQAAGLDKVPVLIRDAVTPAEMLELALIENLHREDLDPIEEAESYQQLNSEFGRTQEDIARLAGRDRSTVANLLRLLTLPAAVQDDVRRGRLTAGHARALLTLDDEERILQAREEILAKGLSVRETEKLVKRYAAPVRKKKKSETDEAYYKSLGEAIGRKVGAKAKVVHRGRRGKIEISYSSIQELERLLKTLGVGPV